MSTYSTTEDMLLGNIPPLKDVTLVQRYVQDGADEIDSKLGMRYTTPIVIADTPSTRAGMLLLKRINNYLATGWYILASSASQESVELNAYGAKLVGDATAALDSLATGATPLPGAATIDPGDMGISGPVLSNLDATSQVENFYQYTQHPWGSGFGHRGFGEPIFAPGHHG